MITRRRAVPLLALLLLAACLVPASAAKKKAKKKKGYDYDASRYKAYGVLADPAGRTYRFDENGNPIAPPSKKKKKKKSSDEAGDQPGDGASCDAADACGAGRTQGEAQPPRSEAGESASADSD